MNGHESTVSSGDTPGESPELSVLVVPFRLSALGLETLVPIMDGAPSLIAGSPGKTETLDDTARRVLRNALQTDERYMEQLYTFSNLTPAGRTVHVSYIALTHAASSSIEDGSDWLLVRDTHVQEGIKSTVFAYALRRLRAKLGYSNVAFHLLPQTFTLSELQLAYEQVLDHQLDKRNFRRRMTASRTLVQTATMRRDVSHRPAALYRFADRDNQAAYLTPSWVAESPSSEAGRSPVTDGSRDSATN